MSIDWSSLVSYNLACLRNEDSFQELPELAEASQRFLFSTAPRERLLSDPESGLPVDGRIAGLVEAARLRGESLFYGYPVVVVRDQTTHRLKVGALLVMELAAPPSATGEVSARLLPKSDEPTLHPILLTSLGVGAEQQGLLASGLPTSRAIGSAQALKHYVDELLRTLQLQPGTEIDPGCLQPTSEDSIKDPGTHNCAMLFRAASPEFNRRLIDELKQLQSRGTEARSTAAWHLITDDPLTALAAASIALCPIEANDAQRAALAAGLTRPLTVVTGPPGTGKSQLVTNLIASAWASAQSVLVVSTNNQAVDVACKRAQAIHPALVIRTGSKEYREKAKEVLGALLAESGSVPDERTARISFEAAQQHYTRLREELEHRTASETRLAEVILGEASLQATIAWPPPDALSRFGGAAAMLRKVHRVRSAFWFKRWRLRRLSVVWGVDLEEFGNAVERYLELALERSTLEAELEREPSTETLVRRILEADQALHKASRTYAETAVTLAVPKARSAISGFVNARVSAGVNRATEVFPGLLQHIRGWASTALSVGATVPLTPGLFDLVVIDEASQCSIAQMLPILYRAKRAVVIGDAQQLTHIASITRAEERARMAAAGLTEMALDTRKLIHSRHSLFDAMAHRAGEANLFLLDEHYRSHPQIIELSNRLFYAGKLTILTDPKKLLDFGASAVAWENVQGTTVRPDTGSALNLEEAKAVVRSVVDLVRHHPGATIGVLTPFAAQATHIQNRLEAVLTEQERMTASLAVGTAHRLQGDERDIIVFSPVTSEGLDARSLSWLTGSPNLFNVAVTRAKSYLLVVGDWHYCSEMSGPLGELAKYARDVTVQRRVEKETASGQLHSPAERLLFEAMLRAGFEVTPKSIVQGYECDFVIKGGALAVNVECDGQHHYTAVGRQRLQDRARDELIRHQGLKVVRIPAWQCLSNPDAITRDLQLQLERPDGRSAGR